MKQITKADLRDEFTCSVCGSDIYTASDYVSVALLREVIKDLAKTALRRFDAGHGDCVILITDIEEAFVGVLDKDGK